MTPAICTAIFLAYLGVPPDHVSLPQPCAVVRQSVQALGMDGAAALASQQGWTRAQVEAAKRQCLGPPQPQK
jgi:hypothetical protein